MSGSIKETVQRRLIKKIVDSKNYLKTFVAFMITEVQSRLGFQFKQNY